MITKEQKQEIVAKYGKDANDTGSAEVQIALLTARINDLKPDTSRLILRITTQIVVCLKMVGQRRNMLAYLKSKDIEALQKADREPWLKKIISASQIRKTGCSDVCWDDLFFFDLFFLIQSCI